jgi:GTPase SAR1 family protein
MITKKVILVGNLGVGKTSLIKRFVLSDFSKDSIHKVGVRVSKKIVAYEDEIIKLIIWNVAEVDGYEKIPKTYFLGASAAMIIFDLSRQSTYLKIDDTIRIVKELSGFQELVVVGNKTDLLSRKELKNVEKRVSVDIDSFTSAKVGENVTDAFLKLIIQALKK